VFARPVCPYPGRGGGGEAKGWSSSSPPRSRYFRSARFHLLGRVGGGAAARPALYPQAAKLRIRAGWQAPSRLARPAGFICSDRWPHPLASGGGSGPCRLSARSRRDRAGRATIRRFPRISQGADARVHGALRTARTTPPTQHMGRSGRLCETKGKSGAFKRHRASCH
jgi:hypothetical protein